MSDPTPDQQPGTPSAETQKPDTHAEPMIPKSRFDEINTKLRRLEQEQAQRDAEARQRADQEAAAKGEFEKLATERQQRLAQIEAEKAQAAERLAAYEAEMDRQIRARFKALPEEIRAMAPDGDVLTRFAWLDKAEAAAAKLATDRTPGTPAGPRGSGAPASISAPGDLITQKRTSIDYNL